ncbi:hypothetical protein TSOC_006433 [Tetrabaena socialis]|uniref:Uncharacterized protein n=1 Tax=Tetrabaena socialis TaxID=47790 RepID=A0A2J8A3N4_9CHLO|nr:hypothetical protein TSOC_006433 [Tetrabaena socialis]|eukprot:PNH07132.1 hypothetical protein TSOC_006433 [Tetrabaena socialis]
MALSEAMRLPAAAARLTGVPGSVPIDATEAEQVVAMLAIVTAAFVEDDANDGSIVDALLADDRLRLALLRLVAFAVRGWHGQSGHFGRVAGFAVAACSSMLDVEPRAAWRGRALLDFGRKLLRMHTLQCCSRRFSEAAAAVQATAAGGGGEGPGGAGGGAGAAAVPAAGDAAAAHVPTAGQQVQPTIALGAYSGSCRLIATMLKLATWDAGAAVPAFTARQSQRFTEQQQLYARELADALRGSCVLEYCARWALHVQLAAAAGTTALLRPPCARCCRGPACGTWC